MSLAVPPQESRPVRFASLYVAVDGSPRSDAAAALAGRLAKLSGAEMTAVHAFAAKLHDNRFKQMEGGLPAKFQEEDELNRQRDVHDDLIRRGLELISESYLDTVSRLAASPLTRRSVEGRNWRVLLEDIQRTAPELVLLGATGLGEVDGIGLGTVCERILRRLDCDALVLRDCDRDPFERIGVALDGSAESLGALASAVAICKLLGGRLELMSSFDPHFHHHVFRAISGVLSEEAGEVFRFEEQQQLHEEIIDQGLARIYRGHLEVGAKVAAEAGMHEVGTALLSGKAPVCVRRWAEERGLSTVFVGRTGVHSSGDLDLGGCTENLLRMPGSFNLFISARGVAPERYIEHQEPLTWTSEAQESLKRIPSFARPMASGAVERRARALGHTVVTSDLLQEVARAAHGCPQSEGMNWTEDAAQRLERAPEGPVRDLTKQRVEAFVKKQGRREVTLEDVEAKYASWHAGATPERTLEWDADAEERIERIPEFVRNAVIEELESRATKRGIERITAEVLTEFRDEVYGSGVFHT